MTWDIRSDRAIYTQLVEQIQLRIVAGVYPAGSKLPSVRDLAAEAAVNPNTMQRALAQLESLELVFSQRTSGRYITEDEQMIEKLKNTLAIEQITAFFEKMRQLGYTPEAVVALVQQAEEEMR